MNDPTHEEMLEEAARREKENQVLEIAKRFMEENKEAMQKLSAIEGFESWFEELEGFAFRSERFYDDFDYAAKTKDYKMIVDWLRTAYEMGYYRGINR